MTSDDYQDLFEKLKINLKNPRIKKVLDGENFDLAPLQEAVNSYQNNEDLVKNTTEDRLLSSIVNSAKKLLLYSDEHSFSGVVHKFINEANVLIENSPKADTISEEDFVKRYDKLIEILHFENEKSNLILETPSDKVPFQLFKNQKNSIIILTKNNSKNSMTKEKLANKIYRDGNTNKISYEPVIIEKILDNSIFDLVQDGIINQNTTNIDEQIKKLEEVQYLYLSREEENKQKLDQISKNEMERQQHFNEVAIMEKQAKSAQTDFQNAQIAILEKFKLQESFKFWEKQRKSYIYPYDFYVIFSVFIVLALLYNVFDFLNTNPSIPSMFLDGNITENLKATIQKRDLWKYGFLILSITLTIWFVRILMKIALSNYHLAVDAKERIVMIRTYLALMQEGKGFEQDDRKVILDNIFRPTNHGIIKDEASITITDILSAIKSK